MRSRAVVAGLATAAIFMANPAQADSSAGMTRLASEGMSVGATTSDGEKLRRLDLMLMVTGLRCRNTADDFQADYQAFEARHLADLNAAARDILATYARRMGVVEANRAVDRLSVQIANQYGAGHPWLGCHDLKELAQALAQTDGREVLLQAANEIMDSDGAAPMIGRSPEVAEAPDMAEARTMREAPDMAEAHDMAEAPDAVGAQLAAQASEVTDAPDDDDRPVIAVR